MSLIDSLKEEVAYLRKENIIKIEIIKSLAEKRSTCCANEQTCCKMNIQIANLIYHWQITKR